ncbi:hypothetical protein PRIPAC_89298, partial [Pristionchus pacificus]|uniref:Uncharacterized protein n=1 Tax=Pristionchus pacificus TaxID=54126 RepID=A0A2A6CXL6_PRIPA
MTPAEQQNTVTDELHLGTISSDVIRQIICSKLESVDAMRLISPRWNSLVLELLNNRKRLPAIDYLQCSAENRIVVSKDDWSVWKKSKTGKRSRLDLVKAHQNLAMDFSFGRACRYLNSVCKAHEHPNYMEKSICDANPYAVTTSMHYSRQTKQQGTAKYLLHRLHQTACVLKQLITDAIVHAYDSDLDDMKILWESRRREITEFANVDSSITNFIATAIRVVPYIELSFPTYTGPHFNSIEGVRIHWKGQLKQLLRGTGNCKGRVLVEFSGRPNYTQPIYQ